ncbi:MAG TPA: hypothetical protein VGS41_12650, partial [Chthonomonadales bacterium]|nr:hypothetical protein [Chthonomonadales bacterium]
MKRRSVKLIASWKRPKSKLVRVVAIVLLCSLSAGVGVAAARPYLRNSRWKAENDRIAARISGIRFANQQIEMKVRTMNTNAGTIV